MTEFNIAEGWPTITVLGDELVGKRLVDVINKKMVNNIQTTSGLDEVNRDTMDVLLSDVHFGSPTMHFNRIPLNPMRRHSHESTFNHHVKSFFHIKRSIKPLGTPLNKQRLTTTYPSIHVCLKIMKSFKPDHTHAKYIMDDLNAHWKYLGGQ